MSKREQVRKKFGGLCAYSGKPLEPDWQIDHITPKEHYRMGLVQGNPNDIDNLIPVQRILNHYKRCKDLKSWRNYLSTLHLRIAKLPKNPRSPKTIAHKAYLIEVAGYFQITADRPFDGIFFMDEPTQH